MSKVNIDNLTKLYYSIGEVADMFEVNTSLIRFWEKEFTQLKPKKNKKGNRLFTVKDIDKLNSIYILVKEQGFTLDGAKSQLKKGVEIISEEPEAASSIESQAVIQKLESIKSKLLKLKSSSN
ncbi:MAG: MerR family transcriptional regulator [Crocinitomicaceae bacterium]